MKKAVYTVVLLDCVYIVLVSLASILSFIPYLSLGIKYAAFVLPLLLLVLMFRKGEYEGRINLLPKRGGFLITLPLIVPSVLLIMGVSFLTTLLMTLLNATPSAVPNYEFFSAFTLHALLPAVCEELVFRFIPLTLIAPHSKKSAILISALLFAFVHGNPYQIPYALVAGLIYTALDVAADSVIPSIILHLCNNTVALLWQGVLVHRGLAIHTLIIMGVLALLSLGAIVLMRKLYCKNFSFLLDKGDRVEMPLILVAPIGIGFILAFTSFL